MILSVKTKTDAGKAIDALSRAVRAATLNTVVKLEGKNPQGLTFTGSGVILYADARQTWLVTAKHNLYIYDNKKDPPAWSGDLVTSFKDRIAIHYDGAMDFGSDPQRKAPVTSITPVKIGGERPWDYDVMILKSTDADLRFFATNNYVIDPSELGLHLGYLVDPRRYLKREGQVFFQMGYGTVTERVKGKLMPLETQADNTAGKLQYRLTSPEAMATTTVYDPRTDNPRVYEQFDDAIQLTADANNSTSRGDSGGPLFSAYYDKTAQSWRLYLIGITTGADMDTARAPYPTGKTLRGNNIATSMKYCYENELFGPETP